MKSTKPPLIDSALTALLALPCLGGRVTFDGRDCSRLLRFAYQVIPCLTDEEILHIYRRPKWTADQAREFLLGRIGIEIAVQSFAEFRRNTVSDENNKSRDVDDLEIKSITELLLDEYAKDNNAPVMLLCARASEAGDFHEGRIKHVLYTYILPDGRHQGCEEMKKKYRGNIQRFNKAKQYFQYLIDIEGR